MQRKKLFILLLPALVLILVILALILGGKSSSKLTINGLSKCSKNINKDVQANIEETVYSYIKQANDYNKKDSQPKYESEIRKNSCQTKESNLGNVKGKIKSTSIILDIPDAKQSWKISYEWYTGETPNNTVINGATAECVAKNEQIYGDFNCEKIISKNTYGTDKYDPILQYMPYFGQGFELTYNPDTKAVTAKIIVPNGELGNATLIQNDKNAVVYWFKHRKLDPAAYKITYQVTEKYADDDGETNDAAND